VARTTEPRANDWENPKLTGRNKQPAHATLMPYADVGTAMGGSSCGPPTLEEYLVHPEPVAFHIRLRPLAKGDSPAALARQKLPRT
jgi:hypothetical protein